MIRGRSRPRLVLLALLTISASAATETSFELPALPDPQEARLAFHSRTGYLSFLGTRGADATAMKSLLAEALPPAAAADHYLSQFARSFGASTDELVPRKVRTSGAGRHVVRYQQLHRSVPVLGGELLVNLGAGNSLLSINGELSPLLELDTTPVLGPAEAQEAVRGALAKWRPDLAGAVELSQPSLAVFDPRLLLGSELPVQLVWVVDAVAATAVFHEQFFVNSNTGAIALHYSRLMHARNRRTHDANGTDNLPGTLVCNEADDNCAAGDAEEKSAHRFARHTYDYYAATHGRDSFDNAGGAMISSVHFDDGSGFPNAFWDGTQTAFSNGLVTDDIVAHEWTHAVTQYESNLFYFDQSGAINESLSDVWGEVIDQLNGAGLDNDAVRWLQGEEAEGGAIRNMADPTQFADPDRVGSPLYHFTDDDNYGVHFNSGINNKAAFLIADGGSFNGFTVAPLNPDRTTSLTNLTRLYYEVQANLLTSGAGYRDLYEALQQACANLVAAATPGFSASSCVEIKKALDAVEMNNEPAVGFYAEAEPCPAGQDVTDVLFASGFETFPQPWTTATLAGLANNWDFGDEIERRGARSAAVSNVGFVADSVLFNSVAIPALPANAYLYFHHIYATETHPECGGFCDGGVIEYSTNNGASWTDAASLFSGGKNYDGVLSNSFQNPLGGRPAFSGVSHVYVPSRYDLSTLAGANLRVRFRFGSDESVGFLGWSVDDVQMHVCAALGDTTPNPFSFADQDDVPVSTTVTSAPVTITGINAPAPISVTGGEYSIGCTASFTGGAGSVSNGQTVCVRHTSAATNDTATDTLLTVGGVSDTFTSMTIGSAPDSTPNAFSFVDQTNVARSTLITSGSITVTGINSPAAVSVAGGEYSLGCTGAFTAAAGQTTVGQTICVRHTSAAAFGTQTDTVLSVGGVSDTFSSTTEAVDTQPDPFSFLTEVNVGLGTTRTSDAVTITGINGPAPISVVDGRYSIGCGSSFTDAAGTIEEGDTVCVRHTAATTPVTFTNTALSIGGVTGVFTSITRDISTGGGGGDDDGESPGSAFRGESEGGGGCAASTRPAPFDPVWLLALLAATLQIRRRLSGVPKRR